jgi:endo-1,4-beta-xylanase
MNVARGSALGAVAVAVLLTFSFPVTAAPPMHSTARHTTGPRPAADTLRALAARSDLRVGTAVDMTALAEDQAYRRRVATEFSSVTAENVMKWQLIEPERGRLDFAAADELVDFARRNGQRVHGHTLVWHSQLPNWLANGTFTPAELRQILRQHIVDQVSHFRGKVRAWDVLNEGFEDDGTLRDTIFLRALGEDYIADVFRWAHQADPYAKLYYNDYNIEGINAKSDAVYAKVKELRRKGVPIHGVGVQGHLGVQFGFPGDVVQNLSRFAALGLETAVTEADVRMILPPDNAKVQAQAQGFNVLLQGCLLAPRCVSYTLWGFTDKYNWVPGVFDGEGSATPLDENFQPKPAWRALQNTLRLAG